ncbi:MAG: hypothetical protein ACRC42_04515 [Mycoplasma sp.]
MKDKYLELIKCLNDFTEIVRLDKSIVGQTKKWINYIDPITIYLYKMPYLEFAEFYKLFKINGPGLLDKYYNIICYLVKDLKTLAHQRIIDDILVSAIQIKELFDNYLRENNYIVTETYEIERGYKKIKYSISPLI